MQLKIAMIGGGNMASALIQGIRSNPTLKTHIEVYDPNPDLVEKFCQQGIPAFVDYHDPLAQADLWVLAVKPQQIASALQDLRPWYQPRHLVLSVAAGIPLAAIAHGLQGQSHQMKLVRTMPNTPALIRAGATGVYATPVLTESEKKSIHDLLACVGSVVWVSEENQLDAVTALSGSGPAYVFLFLEALVQGGVELGLPQEIAQELAIATVRGASELAKQSSTSLAVLREQVTSKGGTTAAALATFEQEHFTQIVQQAMQSAHRRAQELGQVLGEQPKSS